MQQLAQKQYKSKHNCVGNVIHVLLSKWLDKVYMHKAEYDLQKAITNFSRILRYKRFT